MRQESNESIDEFLHRILKCEKEWKHTEHTRFDRDLPSIFKMGLKLEIAPLISSFKFTTFHELLKKAKKIESIIKRKEESYSLNEVSIKSHPKQTFNKTKVKCFKCQNTGHFAKECTNQVKAKGGDKHYKQQMLFCMYCNKTNHSTIDCRLMQTSNSGNKLKPGFKNNKTEGKQKYCKNFSMTNHKTEDCRKTMREDKSTSKEESKKQ